MSINSVHRPNPAELITIAITGHRWIGVTGSRASAVQMSIKTVLREILHATGERAHARGRVPPIRLVSMLADGADLLAAQAALDLGIALKAVLPFSIARYRATFATTEGLDAFDAVLRKVACVRVLEGSPEDDVSYQRANEILLKKAAILIAVWDGLAAKGRGGTGEVVSAAIGRIPVLVVEPGADSGLYLLTRDREDQPFSRLDLREHDLERIAARLRLTSSNTEGGP